VEKQRVNVGPIEYIYSVESLFIDKNPEILFVEYLTSFGRSIIIINPFSEYIDVMQSNSSSVFQTSDLSAACFSLNVVAR